MKTKSGDAAKLLSLLFMIFCISCAAATAPKTQGGAAPPANPTFGKEITLYSNEMCEYYIDGAFVAKGKTVRVRVSSKPHNIVAKAPGYRPKERYIQPPYDNSAPIDFTFMMGERVYAAESRDRFLNYATLAGEMADKMAPKIPDNALVVVTGFIMTVEEKRVSLSSRFEGELVNNLSGLGKRLVERERLDAILKEKALTQTGHFDEEQSEKIGKLVGGDILVTGSFEDHKEEQLVRINVRVIDLKTGALLFATSGDVERSGDIVELLFR